MEQLADDKSPLLLAAKAVESKQPKKKQVAGASGVVEGDCVDARVVSVSSAQVNVQLEHPWSGRGRIHMSQISDEVGSNAIARFAVGDKVEAVVLGFGE